MPFSSKDMYFSHEKVIEIGNSLKTEISGNITAPRKGREVSRLT